MGGELETENGKRFARNIRFLRRASGLVTQGRSFSQGELAERMGLTRRTIISWESGQIPHKSNLASAAEFFAACLEVEIKPSELIEGDLTKVEELLPLSEFERALSTENRKIYRSLFLSTRGMDSVDLEKVIEYVKFLKSRN